MADKSVKIAPITTDEYPTPAKRPLNSRLSLEKLRAATSITPPSWQAGLEQCFKEYLKEQKA
jgi:dTDP-4-dehydrorhamnose reductase